MADITTTLVNEITTADDYRQACLLVQHRIQAGQEVSSSVIHALAVKGHLLNLEDEERSAMISRAFLRTHQADPPLNPCAEIESRGLDPRSNRGILENNVSDDRG